MPTDKTKASSEQAMKSRTIIEAIKEVLIKNGRPMSALDIYGEIVHFKLYDFKADDPYHVVRSQLRRHCAGLEFSTASPTKYFIGTKDGKFDLLSQPHSSKSTRRPDLLHSTPTAPKDYAKAVDALRWLHNIRDFHKKYLEQFKHSTLKKLRNLDPYAFECFSGNLLMKYGFKDVQTTRSSRDGGIDGHGQLKVGLAHLKVAFQCKKWIKGSVGRPDIAGFRGDIQGKYDLGIFFTTSKFTSEAKSCSFQPGAVAVMLIDGAAIVDFMIEKNFGIETEALPLYSLALDMALTEQPKASP